MCACRCKEVMQVAMIYWDYCDGKVYKSHRLFNAHFGALQILFYYDEVEVCLSMCIYILYVTGSAKRGLVLIFIFN